MSSDAVREITPREGELRDKVVRYLTRAETARADVAQMMVGLAINPLPTQDELVAVVNALVEERAIRVPRDTKGRGYEQPFIPYELYV